MDGVIYESGINSIKHEKDELQSLLNYLSKESFLEAARLLAKAKFIVTCGSGSSGIATQKFAHSLCCIEKTAKFMPPSEAIHGGLGCIHQDDVVVIVSRGGETVELLPIIDVVTKKKAKIIALTENMLSTLAKQADIILQMKIARESDPLNIMATSSYIVTIGIFDALLSSIMTINDYKLAEFGLIHPGGAVGNKLNKKDQ